MLLELLAASAISQTYELTIFHCNDSESQLIDLGSGLEDFGGAARFVTKINELRSLVGNSITVSSGDNTIPGPEFNASLDSGVWYDALAFNAIGFDAKCIGNHDFDLGPSTLAEFLTDGLNGSATYLSANLDFSGELALQELVDSGQIASSTLIEKNGATIGIFGLTTPNLPFISSPGAVVVSDQLVSIAQSEINSLRADGADIVIMLSHLQGLENELEIIPALTGLDVAVAGGGDEILANADAVLIPGDSVDQPVYPLMQGNTPVVTAAGAFAYIGQLDLVFDVDGKGNYTLSSASGNPVRVASDAYSDGVVADATVQSTVVDPVVAYVADLATNVIANSEVGLDAVRNNIRAVETNYGNLIADSQLWQAQQSAAELGYAMPEVAIQNGGGIRNDSVVIPGDYTALDTFDACPFGNFLSVLPSVSSSVMHDLLENCVQQIEYDADGGRYGGGTGRFGQIAGGTLQYNNARCRGDRVISFVLDSGRAIVVNGEPVADESVSLVLNSFIAAGGDEYPTADEPIVVVGVPYQRCLQNYVVDALSGSITASDYPEGGEGRIQRDFGYDFDGSDTIDMADVLYVIDNWGSFDNFDFDVLLGVLVTFGQ